MKYSIELTPEEHLIVMQALAYMVMDENVSQYSKDMAYKVQTDIKKMADEQRRKKERVTDD